MGMPGEAQKDEWGGAGGFGGGGRMSGAGRVGLQGEGMEWGK